MQEAQHKVEAQSASIRSEGTPGQFAISGRVLDLQPNPAIIGIDDGDVIKSVTVEALNVYKDRRSGPKKKLSQRVTCDDVLIGVPMMSRPQIRCTPPSSALNSSSILSERNLEETSRGPPRGGGT